MNLFQKYYHQDLDNFTRYLIPSNSSFKKIYDKPITGKFKYLILPNSLSHLNDVQTYIENLQNHCDPESRIIVFYFNLLWKPILDLATILGLRKKDLSKTNWLTSCDINNIFYLANFQLIKEGKRLLLPLNLGLFSTLVNKYLAQLPIINQLCLSTYQIYKLTPKPQEYSVSIIIPARNESENIKGILFKIPVLGTDSEVIFIEGNSKDDTYEAIENEIRTNQTRHKPYLYKQTGRGKADAVRLGYNKVKNQVIIILDADLTVDPKELPKFYKALIEGKGDFINGSRLIYPMEKQAMQSLNHFANIIFGWIFSFLLGQRISDTLCGTKVFFRNDHKKIKKNQKFFGNFDPFGDFDLLFGASKLNLKIVEVPIHYKDRTYGSTNINRFAHGWLLIKMTFFAAKKLKFI